MAEGDPDDRGGEPPLEDRLHRLEARLAAQRQADDAAEAKARPPSGGYAEALKLGSEFVSGVIVGAGIGWIVDRGLGTAPFGLIVFLLLGFGAGVLNVLRSQGKVAEAGEQLRRRRDRRASGDSDDR